MSIIETLQRISVDWGTRCFGQSHMKNKAIRALRFAEEAIELAQACGVDKETMAKLVGIVYQRPVGAPLQEIGGCMVTLSVLGDVTGINLEEAFEIEVRRCLTKTPEHFAKRNEEKISLGLHAVNHDLG